MTTADSERAEFLATEARSCIEKRELQKASRLVKEALSLAPNNPSVKSVLLLLQGLDNDDQILNLCKNYVSQAVEKDGRDALRQLRSHSTVRPQEVVELLKLLLEHPGPATELLDELISTLLATHLAARSDLAKGFLINTEATRIFALLYQQGERSFKTLSTILLDQAAWTSQKDQREAKRDVFQLALGKLLDPALEHGDWLMSLIARLLASNPKDLTGLLDVDVFEIVLSSLDIRLDASIRSQATLATIKLLEETGEKGEAHYSTFVTNTVAKTHNDDLIIAFSAAAAVFPINPAVTSKLFLTPGFLEGLIPTLEKNSRGQRYDWLQVYQPTDRTADVLPFRKSHKLEQAALELMSAACIDKACREAVSKYCLDWLDDVAHTSNEAEFASMAALVLAKIGQEATTDPTKTGITNVDDLSTTLVNMTLNANSAAERQSSIEGLAYTSVQPKVKENISANTDLLNKLVHYLTTNTSKDPSTFGILTVFANLTMYRPSLTEEQKRMTQLKSYANSQRPVDDNPFDDDQHVTARCKNVLNAGLVPVLLSNFRDQSATMLGISITVVHALAKEQKHRGLLAQQGAIKLLMQSLEKLQDKKAADGQPATATIAHALARILISVNPLHIFSAGLPASSAIRPLASLLPQDETAEQRNLLATFESLLALTNLASMEDESVRDTIIRSSWQEIEDLLLSSNTLVQRATVELVCNLMASPSGVAKFADGSKPAQNRLHILLALADVEDFATRRAAGGALAMLTEWDAAVEAVLSKERGVDILLGMCEDDSDEMRHRGMACVLNVVTAPGNVGDKGTEMVKKENGVEVLKASLQKSRNPEVMSVGVEALKKLVR
ncbi:hypothetical protein MBLNU459_g1987t3 [Dothideomycetes sp. NU459]